MKAIYSNIEAYIGKCEKFEIKQNQKQEDYRKTEHISSSELKESLDDPLYMVKRVVEERPKEETSSTAVGSGIHTQLLERDDFDKTYTFFPGKVRRGKAWDEFKSQNPGKTILTQREYEEVVEADRATAGTMASAYKGHLDMGAKRIEKYSEVSFYLTFSSGVLLKVRPDFLEIFESKDGQKFFVITDLKSTAKSINDSKGLAMAIHDYQYALSAAMYTYCVYQCLQGVPGYFNLLWYSKKTKMCGLQQNFAQTHRNETEWDNIGMVGFLAGLHTYIESLKYHRERVIKTKEKSEFDNQNYYSLSNILPLSFRAAETGALVHNYGLDKLTPVSEVVSKSMLKDSYKMKYKLKEKFKNGNTEKAKP